MVNISRVGEYASNIKHEVRRFVGLSILAVSLILLAACGGEVAGGTTNNSTAEQPAKVSGPYSYTLPEGYKDVGIYEVVTLDQGCGVKLQPNWNHAMKKYLPIDCEVTAQVMLVVKEQNSYIRVKESDVLQENPVIGAYCIPADFFVGESKMAQRFREIIPTHACQ